MRKVWQFKIFVVPLHSLTKRYGSVAQLNRASDYGSEGSGFESQRSHFFIKQIKFWFGSVAQLNRASDYGSEGSGFESQRSHKKGVYQNFGSSSFSYYFLKTKPRLSQAGALSYHKNLVSLWYKRITWQKYTFLITIPNKLSSFLNVLTKILQQTFIQKVSKIFNACFYCLTNDGSLRRF